MARKKSPLPTAVREDATPTGMHGIMREDLINPEVKNPGSRIREIIPVLTCFIVGAILLFGISEIGERGSQTGEIGARAWPLGLGWAIILLGAIILGIAAVKIKSPMEYPDKITKNGFVKFVLTIVVLFAYVYTFRTVPFWASTLVTVVVLLLIFDMKKLKSLVVFSAIMTVTLQLLFINLLKVPL